MHVGSASRIVYAPVFYYRGVCYVSVKPVMYALRILVFNASIDAMASFGYHLAHELKARVRRR